ncbi:adp-ribosylation factor f-related [Anaeramoeba ignava]|uniref:Adp-ribosylation factor f-related n=1 Tax=Anaeramoeba ignava TaxID=1746090 RepID=A0A9Q0R4E3_ANAIG|nr:adp-ribosylation factor f-related [Anaeramoeba ignava]
MGVCESCMKKADPFNIIMFGLSGGGKTSILYKLKTGTTVEPAITSGANNEIIKVENTEFHIWDIAGNESSQSNWKFFCNFPQAIVYVVDSTDSQKILKGKEEMRKIVFQPDFNKLPLLVFGNKSDDQNSIPINQVMELLSLNEIQDRQWFLQKSSSVSGEGLFEGLKWLSDILKMNN